MSLILDSLGNLAVSYRNALGSASSNLLYSYSFHFTGIWIVEGVKIKLSNGERFRLLGQHHLVR